MSNGQQLVVPALFVLAALGPARPQTGHAGASEMPPDKFITVNRVRLQYLDWGGTGNALLFLTLD